MHGRQRLVSDDPAVYRAKTVPTVIRLPDHPGRPFWSVMIPTYEPRPELLVEAVRSVIPQLGEDPDVQIELVDDASPSFDVETFANKFDGARVSWSRNEQRRGLAGNWNACIERARGRWVHILHQDDLVLDGFYAAMREGIDRAPEVGAAFCDTYFVDGNGRRRRSTLVPMREAGVLEDWHRHVFVQLAIQAASIVVHRRTYELVGGFDPGFSYALDWDMWKRIAVCFPMWYEPRPLACYRRHRGSETARLRRIVADIAEIARSITQSELLLPAAVAADLSQRARRAYTVFAVENAFELLLREGAPRAALGQLGEARRMSSAPTVARALGWVVMRSLLRPVRDAVRRRSDSSRLVSR